MTVGMEQRIKELRNQRKAVILAHNYQRAEVQDMADFVGDSLGLARTAARTEAEAIVFCGVHFMAETAAILCPGKKVLMPDLNAGCPMADMITPRELKQFKQAHDGAVVVTYVNSSVEIKALSDVCCTSSNAVEIVAALPPERKILFVPDRNLGHYVGKMLKREIVCWQGYCPTHQRIMPEHVEAARLLHPAAVVVVHPECRPAVVDMADHVASTTGIMNFCRRHTAGEFIVGTEIGILHPLQKENPGKRFYPVTELADCVNMKLTTLEKVLWCLEDMAPVVTVPPDIAEKARAAIMKMF